MDPLSARSQIPRTIVQISKRQRHTFCVEIGAGVIVTSSITHEAADDLDLHIGDTVLAIVKVSDVMIGK